MYSTIEMFFNLQYKSSHFPLRGKVGQPSKRKIDLSILLVYDADDRFTFSCPPDPECGVRFEEDHEGRVVLEHEGGDG